MPAGNCNVDEFVNLSDEELVCLCKKSDKAARALVSRYSKNILAKSLNMANQYVDADDLMQEGLLGLIFAASSFDVERGVKFSTYSDVCITNKMKTALIKSNRTDIPIEVVPENENIGKYGDTPESIFLERENFQELCNGISSLLSKQEWEVFRLFLKGSTYNQMARQLNVSQKTVDNDIQRVRRKLKLVRRADHFTVK
jgi:RNA polymerase sporulation-specific sigma factor